MQLVRRHGVTIPADEVGVARGSGLSPRIATLTQEGKRVASLAEEDDHNSAKQ